VTGDCVVSIILPTLNRAELLSLLMASLKANPFNWRAFILLAGRVTRVIPSEQPQLILRAVNW